MYEQKDIGEIMNNETSEELETAINAIYDDEYNPEDIELCKIYAEQGAGEAQSIILYCYFECEGSGISREEFENYGVSLVKRGDESAAGFLAEEFARESNDEKSYFWYFIHYFLNDYETNYFNTEQGEHYSGKVSDFRNEAAVSELIESFTEEKIYKIDSDAKSWLKENGLWEKTI